VESSSANDFDSHPGGEGSAARATTTLPGPMLQYGGSVITNREPHAF
jgi:hypothetical protein